MTDEDKIGALLRYIEKVDKTTNVCDAGDNVGGYWCELNCTSTGPIERCYRHFLLCEGDDDQ